MLVLSRRVNDSILLPELNVSIEIVQVKGKSVRVGIDAPIEIKVLRGELESAKVASPEVAQLFSVTGQDEHEVRNKINTLNIAVAFAQKLIERGEIRSAAAKLHQAFEDIQDQAEPSNSKKTLRALLVEDVENEREMLAGFLRLHGYQVDTVPNGIAAMDYLESNPKPDMVMLDIGMPQMNGRELICKIRENPSLDLVKLFAISGESPKSAKVNMQTNRIAKWFQKPLKPTELVFEINREFEHVSMNPTLLAN